MICSNLKNKEACRVIWLDTKRSNANGNWIASGDEEKNG
jgi:hypothetical protein